MKALPNILNFFIDTQILVDSIIPYRSQRFLCSKLLINDISKGVRKGWIIDYVLSETLGELKNNLEKKKHLDYLKREVLSDFEIERLVEIIEQVKRIPNLEIFKTPIIEQKEIFYKVRNLCVEAKDALILISALQIREKWGSIILVSRDERFLVRAKKEVSTAHPSEFIKKCPEECLSKNICKFYK